MCFKKAPVAFFVLKYEERILILARFCANLPMFFDMDISFSFSIMIRFRFFWQLLSASCIIPPVYAPSPSTTTVYASLPFSLSDMANPSPAENDVELCPAPNASNSLSSLLVNPEIPPGVLMVLNLSNLPVSILWT